jgi:hypothetical protein
VIAVLWEHGEFSYYPARLGARIVAAYVEKQRRLQNNLMPVKTPNPKPVEVGAVWTAPNPAASTPGEPETKMQAGKFYVAANGTVAGGPAGKSSVTPKTASGASKSAVQSGVKSSSSPTISGEIKSNKPGQQESQSARLGAQPALPGKPAQVKSQ